MQKYLGEKKGGIFDGIFKLPNFKLPWGGDRRRDQSRPGVQSDVEVVPMGVQPGHAKTSDKVPVHRTGGGEKGPQVYPSAFGGNSAPVVAPEQTEDNHFLGPRGLKFNKREAGEEEEILERSRRGLKDELGVGSGYQVISEVDLAFKPSFEDGVGVTVFQGRILPEEIVYGVCLPATGFSVLFVLLSLLTVISVLVSGQSDHFSMRHCYQHLCSRLCLLSSTTAEGGGGGGPRPRPGQGSQPGAGLGHRHAPQDAQGLETLAAHSDQGRGSHRH